MHYFIHTYDDGELNQTSEVTDEEQAWGMFYALTEMYMRSKKRRGDQASVVLECITDDEEFVLARYEQFPTGSYTAK